ncbi:MAG TPA: tetratricopeptide repeat-containing protein, partial [Terriglobales bacterium]
MPNPENLRLAEKIADLLDGRAGPNLTAEQRKQDLARALAHLEALGSLGYGLVPPAPQQTAVAGAKDGLEEPIQAAGHDLRQLRQVWANHDKEAWRQAPAPYAALGAAFLDCGEPLLAYDVLRQGLEAHPAEYRMRQLCALALLRSGAVESARAILLNLLKENSADEESLGMLARAEKNLALSETDPVRRKEYWRRAFELYRDAFQRTGGYWTGINAATIALVLKDESRARDLANEVIRLCHDEIGRAPAGNNLFWAYATLGEA